MPHPTINNLVALTTGPVPPSPADLLSSHRMREAIAELRHRFKFVVIDSPPVMAATDAVIISALTDGVLLVVRSGETPKEAFTRTRDLLAAVKCRLLGVVLNAVDSSAPDYYYSYRYYPYAYGYGYGEDVGKTSPVSIRIRRYARASYLRGVSHALSHNRRRRIHRLSSFRSAYSRAATKCSCWTIFPPAAWKISAT